MWRLSWMLVAALCVTSCGSGETADPRRGEPSETRVGADALVARAQEISSDSLLVDEASPEAPGYVALFEDGGGAPGRLVGSSALLDAGSHRDVRVKITAESADVGDGGYLVVMSEDNDNETLDYPSGDGPRAGAGGVVLLKVSID